MFSIVCQRRKNTISLHLKSAQKNVLIIYAPRKTHERGECVTVPNLAEYMDKYELNLIGVGRSSEPGEEVESAAVRLSDEDRPAVINPKPIKREEEVKCEFEEKNQFLLGLNTHYQLDLSEIDCAEFVEWIFERRVGVQRDVVPFEDKMSKEYLIWVNQKRAGAKQLDYRGYACWRYNPIIFYSENKKGHHRVFLKNEDGELDDETLNFLDQRQFALMAPITYVGRNNIATNARYLYAIGFDLDGVGIKQLRILIRMMQDDYVPMANIITNSGHGLHLYYILESPVPLFKENLPILNKLKHGLTNIIWNDRTSILEARQHQSILQGFRLPGTLTKFGVPIRAFHIHDAPFYTIEKLNERLEAFKLTEAELDQLHKAPVYDPTGVTLEEAKRLWPEWYASRVLKHKRVGRKWHVKRDVYDWWLRKLREADQEIKVHHRYWCILTLVVYAVKCDIPREEVLADAYNLVPKLDTYTEVEDNHFTVDDVNDAMKAYDENYSKWPIHTIESTTLFHIERNRRNKRKQDVHLKRARAVQVVDDPDGNWRGRPQGSVKTVFDSNNAEKVREWMKNHPESQNKNQCARDTGLHRNTVRKWWNALKKHKDRPLNEVLTDVQRTGKRTIVHHSIDGEDVDIKIEKNKQLDVVTAERYRPKGKK